MKTIHKYIIAVVFALCLLIPISTRAATIEELQAVINSLLAQIQTLQTQLTQIKNVTTGATTGVSRPGCYVFSTNFGYGSSGQKVADLQAVLEKEGFTINSQEKDKDVFLTSTQSAVSKFQEKYRDDILVPTGLEQPNGFIGRVSRLKLNEIYGCDDSHYISPNPTVPLSPSTGGTSGTSTTGTVIPGLKPICPNGQIAVQPGTLISPLPPDWCAGGIITAPKIDANGCATPPTCSLKTSTATDSCQMLWWKDNSNSVCSQKQFCGIYMYQGLKTFATETACKSDGNTPVACTMEAKLCPDGKTYVGRTGPRCEFSACPTTTPKCDTGLLYMPSCNGVPVQNPNTCEITCSNPTNPPLPATTTPFSANPVPPACTNVMKLCPDGKTFVGATGPQCSFAPCPAPTTKFAMVCDYAAPPAGCSYVAGPSFDPASQCGMVLSCSSTVGSKTKEMCPKYMCAAPPAGFHYAPDPNNVCSCGILSPGNELQ